MGCRPQSIFEAISDGSGNVTMTTRVGANKSRLALGRDSKAGREEGKFDSEKRLQVSPDWRLLAWEAA